METAEITIQVTPDVARIYSNADPQRRLKLGILFSLKLQEVSERSLSEIVKDIRSQAERNGLTEDILEEMLDGSQDSR